MYGAADTEDQAAEAVVELVLHELEVEAQTGYDKVQGQSVIVKVVAELTV